MNTNHKEFYREFPLQEYKSRYKVSNEGKIWSNRKGKNLNTYISKGYNCISVNKPGSKNTKQYRVDRLIAMAFLGKLDNYLIHIDGCATNDHADNLELVEITTYLSKKYSGRWKQIPKFPSYYVSSIGYVWSKYSEKIIKQHVTSGYKSVNMGYPKQFQRRVNRLVAEAFCQMEVHKLIVNHKDCDRFNNNSENLEWCTLSENVKHAMENKEHNIKVKSFKYVHTDHYSDLGIEFNQDDGYLICASGHIYSKKTSQYLTEYVTDCGYLKVGVYIKGKNRHLSVHRLVAEAWLDLSTPAQTQVNHKDMDKLNNSIENLEWVTQSENIKHSKQNNPKQYKHLQKSVAQINIDTDKVIEVFAGLKSAGRSTGINSGSICKACKLYKGKTRPTAGGFKWKYILTSI